MRFFVILYTVWLWCLNGCWRKKRHAVKVRMKMPERQDIWFQISDNLLIWFVVHMASFSLLPLNQIFNLFTSVLSPYLFLDSLAWPSVKTCCNFSSSVTRFAWPNKPDHLALNHLQDPESLSCASPTPSANPSTFYGNQPKQPPPDRCGIPNATSVSNGVRHIPARNAASFSNIWPKTSPARVMNIQLFATYWELRWTTALHAASWPAWWTPEL